MGQDQERRDAETPSSITNPDKSIAMPFIKSHVPGKSYYGRVYNDMLR